MSPLLVCLLVAANLALVYILLAMPLGQRTIVMARRVRAPAARLWSALWPLGADAGWSQHIVAAAPVEGDPVLVRTALSWEDRNGRPIEHVVRLDDVVEGVSFTWRVVDDSALEADFWSAFHERVDLQTADGITRVKITSSDRYRGLAYLAFRYFAQRRRIGKLKRWAETGRYRPGGVFEHPATQCAMAVLSAFILWPLFGLSVGGFVMAALLTLVVALHELGHMAAFRVMGHRRTRMIFVPLLGGIAIGGRPYNSRFEVAFVALMGAGFSAFLVPVAIAGAGLAEGAGAPGTAAVLQTLAGFAALFNLANLVPVWKFDGGQVLRQIVPGPVSLAVASFLMLAAFLWLGWLAGFPMAVLVIAGGVFAILSLITSGTGARPRHDLVAISPRERAAVGGALVAVFAIHGAGVLWAAERLV